MKCYYEVLGVGRDANDDDLKRAYRKLALQWHPDKNLENAEEATEQFRTIQQAYEVLVDPQERAWYDRHREAILKGGLGENYTDDSLDLFQYFNSSCYSGYNDSEKGFYTVFTNVFTKLAAEDLEFCDDTESIQKRETAPRFGCSTDSYEDVGHAFYAYWQSYCTMKTYTWLDKYDVRDAPNRRVLRLMEKENKKIRDQARRKRNEEVRALVAFVRKRDKRVQAHKKILAERAAENERKAEENRRKQLNDRRKCLETYQESDWSAMSQVEDILLDIEANIASEFGEENGQNSDKNDSDDDDGDAINLDLYCIACDKEFKSPKAFENHEQSKKHKENVTILKQTMQEEENTFTESQIADNNDDDDIGSLSEPEVVPQPNKRKQKKQKKKNRKVVEEHPIMSDDDLETTVVDMQKIELGAVSSKEVLPEASEETTAKEATIDTSTDKREKAKARKAEKKFKIPKETRANLVCQICITATQKYPRT